MLGNIHIFLIDQEVPPPPKKTNVCICNLVHVRPRAPGTELKKLAFYYVPSLSLVSNLYTVFRRWHSQINILMINDMTGL